MYSQSDLISPEQITDFERDGAVLIPGLFKEWTDKLIAGIETNMAHPGPHAAENLKQNERGRFFDDYCNWQRIPEFVDFVTQSPAAEAAAQLMRSQNVQMFHDHVLVKEPGTSKPTPWHQDSPYYFIDGEQTVSFWIPVDPVKEASLRLVAGSHKWPKPVLPTRWLSEQDFYPADDQYLQVPDPDSEPEKYQVLEWPMQPGMRWPFTTKRCMAHAAIIPIFVDGRSHFGWSAMMRVMWNVPAPHRPPLPGMA